MKMFYIFSVAFAIVLKIGSASTLEKVLNEVRTLQAEHKLMKIKITELESTVAAQRIEIDNLIAQLLHAKNDTGSIAFSVEITNTVGPSAQDVIIPYGREIFRLGTGYDLNTYTFSAPVRGLYFFSWTTLQATDFKGCSYLCLNGKAFKGYGMLGAESSPGWESGAQTALVILQSGDTVNIRVGDDERCMVLSATSRNIDRAVTFKGFLIRNMEII